MEHFAKIGFIGVGAMGEPMARCLRRAGFPVTACAHRNRAPLERLAADGVAEAADPAAVAAVSDIVIICVPDAPQVEEVLFGERGAVLRQAQDDREGVRDDREGVLRQPFDRLRVTRGEAGVTFVDMSTISPMVSRAIAARLAAAGDRFVDAPVSGGPLRARDGTLTIMAGAGDEDFERVEPILRAMGTPFHVGPVGLGETVKLVNQLIISSVMLANIEALTFAKAAGADLDAVRKVIATATGSNYLLENWLPKTWFAGTFEGGFAMDLLRKDLAAALDAARSMKVPLPVAALAYQLYTLQSAEGDGARDYSAVAKFYERIAPKQTRDV